MHEIDQQMAGHNPVDPVDVGVRSLVDMEHLPIFFTEVSLTSQVINGQISELNQRMKYRTSGVPVWHHGTTTKEEFGV